MGAPEPPPPSLAFNLSSWPATIFSLPVRAVAPALLARLQADRRAVRTAFLSATRLLAAVTLPAWHRGRTGPRDAWRVYFTAL